MNVSISWETARHIEQAFRSFFTIRRAALYQIERTTPAFREAAAKSADPIMAAAARGKPPAYKPWSASDPLGDGWNKIEVKGPQNVADVKLKPGPPTKPQARPKAKPPAKPGQTSELVKLAIVGVTGLAVLGYSERARLRAWVKRFLQRFRRRYGKV